MRKLLVLHNSLLGCAVISALAQHAQFVKDAKVEVVDELPEPEPIKYNSYKRYITELPDIPVSAICYPTGNTKKVHRDMKNQHRYAANRHNFRKR